MVTGLIYLAIVCHVMINCTEIREKVALVRQSPMLEDVMLLQQVRLTDRIDMLFL